jgi:pantoate--beta-alanine ligase
MKVIRSPDAMQALALRLRRKGRVIGFVPTMGCLHAGHIALMARARSAADIVVASIFVNPIQFGPGEDFRRYPRTFRRDAAMCRAARVDILFHPDVADMYAADHSVYVDETEISDGLCGASRPGHFRGVCTVVTKLLNIVQPDLAVFGRKDAQQARIVERMVRDLNMPVKVVVVPTVREADGLAMSSRNAYLSSEERRRAADIHAALETARRMAAAGERNAGELCRAVARLLAKGAPPMDIDYISVVDYDSFEVVRRLSGESLLAVAVRIGTTRLIDNVRLLTT